MKTIITLICLGFCLQTGFGQWEFTGGGDDCLYLKNYKGDLLCSTHPDGIRRYQVIDSEWDINLLFEIEGYSYLFEVFQNRIFTGAPNPHETIRIYEENVPDWKNPIFHTEDDLFFNITEGFHNHNDSVIFLLDHWPSKMYSIDGGENFYPFNLIEDTKYSGYLLDLASEGDRLFAIGADEKEKFERSDDLGETWQKIALPIDTNEVYAINVIANPGIVAAIVGNRFRGDIDERNFLSFDRGLTWKETTSFKENPLHQIYLLNGFLFATFGNYSPSQEILFSGDQGDTWQSFTEGLPDSYRMWDFFNIGETLFLSTTNHGVWKYDLKTFTSIVKSNKTTSQLKVFPNPTSDRIFLEKENGLFLNSHIKIFTAEGRMVKSVLVQKENQMNFDVSGFSKGLYFLQVADSQGVTINKFDVK